MRLAVLPAALVAGGLLLTAAPASAQEIPPVFDLLNGKPVILEDQCVVSYVDGRWEIVCVPYGYVDRIELFGP